ncbi:MAG: class I SAM-dependent methyltransferase, partial [Bacteroidota bacterium]
LPANSRAMRRWAWGWWWFGLIAVGTYGFYVEQQALAVVAGIAGWLVVLATSLAAVAVSAPAQHLLSVILQRRGRTKWAWIRSVLPTMHAPRSLLDLGAGEGWVGWAAASHSAAEDVHLADVVDLNQTPLPHVRYDGEQLPFDPARFDTVLLVFVLHHAHDPEAVLREARRVVDGNGYVVVIESVYSNRFNHALLRFLDIQANRLRGGGEMMEQEEHLAFDTVEGWRERFASEGLHVVAESARGRWIHRQHLFVLQP